MLRLQHVFSGRVLIPCLDSPENSLAAETCQPRFFAHSAQPTDSTQNRNCPPLRVCPLQIAILEIGACPNGDRGFGISRFCSSTSETSDTSATSISFFLKFLPGNIEGEGVWQTAQRPRPLKLRATSFRRKAAPRRVFAPALESTWLFVFDLVGESFSCLCPGKPRRPSSAISSYPSTGSSTARSAGRRQSRSQEKGRCALPPATAR